jgi:hypothetical protein
VDAQSQHAGSSELIAGSDVRVGPLIDREVDIDEAPAIYDQLAKADGALPLCVLIHYPDEPAAEAEFTRIVIRGHRAAATGRVNYALVGAGAFGTGMLVPQMRKRADRYFLRGVVSRTGTK